MKLTAPDNHTYIAAADLAAHRAGTLTAAPYTAAAVYLGRGDSPDRYALITVAEAAEITAHYQPQEPDTDATPQAGI